MLLDLRYALRMLVLLRPLPFREPERLVSVQELIPKLSAEPVGLPAPDVVDVQTRNHVFEAVAGWVTERFDLSGRGEPWRVRAARVSPSLFPILGVAAAAGRAFTGEEDRPGRLVAVLPTRSPGTYSAPHLPPSAGPSVRIPRHRLRPRRRDCRPLPAVRIVSDIDYVEVSGLPELIPLLQFAAIELNAI